MRVRQLLLGKVRFTDTGDPNRDGAMFNTQVSPTTGTYGSLTITTAGVWTYTLNKEWDQQTGGR